jgi:hypothetical protein
MKLTATVKTIHPKNATPSLIDHFMTDEQRQASKERRERRLAERDVNDTRSDRQKVQAVTERVGRCLQMSSGDAREQEVHDLHNYMFEASEAGWLPQERWFTLLDLLDLLDA